MRLQCFDNSWVTDSHDNTNRHKTIVWNTILVLINHILTAYKIIHSTSSDGELTITDPEARHRSDAPGSQHHQAQSVCMTQL